MYSMDFRRTKFSRFMNNRVPSSKRYQPTEYEHAANCATHGFWIIPSILGSTVLYSLSDDQWETISAWMYGTGLSGLFIMSTMFHTVTWKKSHLRKVEQRFHMCDRMVIYFFIAASYAPWLNLRELGPWAVHMRWLVWIMACAGSAYVFFFHENLTERVCWSCQWAESSIVWALSSSRVMDSSHSLMPSGTSLWQLGLVYSITPSGGTCMQQGPAKYK